MTGSHSAGPVPSPAGLFTTIIPKIFVCEPPKVLQIQLCLARGLERSQLRRLHKRNTASLLPHVGLSTPRSARASLCQGKTGPLQGPPAQQLLSTCRHLATRPSFEVQAKLGKRSCLGTCGCQWRKGIVGAPSLLPPKFRSWHFSSCSVRASAVPMQSSKAHLLITVFKKLSPVLKGKVKMPSLCIPEFP